MPLMQEQIQAVDTKRASFKIDLQLREDKAVIKTASILAHLHVIVHLSKNTAGNFQTVTDRSVVKVQADFEMKRQNKLMKEYPVFDGTMMTKNMHVCDFQLAKLKIDLKGSQVLLFLQQSNNPIHYYCWSASRPFFDGNSLQEVTLDNWPEHVTLKRPGDIQTLQLEVLEASSPEQALKTLQAYPVPPPKPNLTESQENEHWSCLTPETHAEFMISLLEEALLPSAKTRKTNCCKKNMDQLMQKLAELKVTTVEHWQGVREWFASHGPRVNAAKRLLGQRLSILANYLKQEAASEAIVETNQSKDETTPPFHLKPSTDGSTQFFLKTNCNFSNMPEEQVETSLVPNVPDQASSSIPTHNGERSDLVRQSMAIFNDDILLGSTLANNHQSERRQCENLIKEGEGVFLSSPKKENTKVPENVKPPVSDRDLDDDWIEAEINST